MGNTPLPGLEPEAVSFTPELVKTVLQAEIEANDDIKDMIRDTMDGVETVIRQANEFVVGLQGYSYLWLDERKAYLDNFLTYSRQLTAEEAELVAMQDPLAPQPSPPRMEHFREQVGAHSRELL